mmetsp:Transcript_83355/g.178704  ORF Transcript_83355/g.178704 Transcript_83355/m.178704 type:complete len:289 (+) Transcript_83355:55-921(+)
MQSRCAHGDVLRGVALRGTELLHSHILRIAQIYEHHCGLAVEGGHADAEGTRGSTRGGSPLVLHSGMTAGEEYMGCRVDDKGVRPCEGLRRQGVWGSGRQVRGLQGCRQGLKRRPQLRASQQVLHRLPRVSQHTQSIHVALERVAHRPEAAPRQFTHFPEEQGVQRHLWQGAVARVTAPGHHIHGHLGGQLGIEVVSLCERGLQGVVGLTHSDRAAADDDPPNCATEGGLPLVRHSAQEELQGASPSRSDTLPAATEAQAGDESEEGTRPAPCTWQCGGEWRRLRRPR